MILSYVNKSRVRRTAPTRVAPQAFVGLSGYSETSSLAQQGPVEEPGFQPGVKRRSKGPHLTAVGHGLAPSILRWLEWVFGNFQPCATRPVEEPGFQPGVKRRSEGPLLTAVAHRLAHSILRWLEWVFRNFQPCAARPGRRAGLQPGVIRRSEGPHLTAVGRSAVEDAATSEKPAHRSSCRSRNNVRASPAPEGASLRPPILNQAILSPLSSPGFHNSLITKDR